MIVHQVYAQILDDEVKNIFVCDNYEIANYLARTTLGDNSFAVDCLQYSCQIGDKYIDNFFYRVDGDGNKTAIDYVPTAEQEVEQLKLEAEKANDYNIDLDYRISMIELGI